MASVAAPTAAVGHRELYDDLCQKLKEVERLSGIQGLLSWDEQVCARTWVGSGKGVGWQLEYNIFELFDRGS